MKLKSAHIFLAAASLATLTVLAGCGSNSSGDLTSPGYNVGDLVSVPQLVSLALTPATTTAHVGQGVQLTAQGTFTNGQVNEVNSGVSWSSSDNSIATVNSSGLVTAKLPGTVTITASRGTASATAQFTVNPFINRLFVVDFGSNAIRVFPTDANGTTVAPLRSISGSNTGISGPSQIAVSGQELFLANGGGNSDVRVFSLQGEGNIAPLRVLDSPGLSAVDGVAVINNELFVSSGSSIFVFNVGESGDAVVPKRTITGANTLLGQARQLTGVGNQLAVGGAQRVLGFPLNANGDVAPTRNLTSMGVTLLNNPTSVASTATELFVGDAAAASVHRFNANANTTDVPLNTISGVATGLNSPRGLAVLGSEVFVADVDAVRVFPTTQAGNVAPARIIQNPTLSPSGGIVFAGSF